MENNKFQLINKLSKKCKEIKNEKNEKNKIINVEIENNKNYRVILINKLNKKIFWI